MYHGRAVGHPAGASVATRVDLSVIIPALEEGENLALLLPQLRAGLEDLGAAFELLVVTREIDPLTEQAAAASGARVIVQRERGYGGALLAGFAEARGDHLVTMDADLSHPAAFVRTLWANRQAAEVVIASRYVPGGKADMPLGRYVLSRVLNRVFSRGLSLYLRDMSSGFRLYHARVLKGQTFAARDFNILQEVLVRAYGEGWRVAEVPFHYQPRQHGESHARVLKFGIAYLRTLRRMWGLRNSASCADYDARAYDSDIPLQRYWQRTRYRLVNQLAAGEGPVLDLGCGSSRILSGLPEGSVGVDLLLPKLRYARRYGRTLVQASGVQLPFGDAAFRCVVCSQVIEHLPKDGRLLDELYRVLAPGGRLIVGTPDYGRWQWVWIERLYRRIVPGGYAREHMSRYTREELVTLLGARGLRPEATRYILGGELILACRKPPGAV